MKKILYIILLLNLVVNKIVAQTITFSEVNYKSAASLDCGDWIELHNYGTMPMDISNWILQDSTSQQPYVFALNTIIAAGDYVILTRKKSQFLQIYPTVPQAKIIGIFNFKIDSQDSLLLYDQNYNIVVRARINSNKYWPDGADGEGRTMQLIDETNSIDLITNTKWRDGCMLGSPGDAPQTDCGDPIIITEINFDSDSMKNQGEFVELYNNTTSPFSLDGWYIKDGIDSIANTFNFPAGFVLAPNSYVVVSNDTLALQKYHGKKSNFLGNFDFNLNNGGELLRLFSPANILKFSMHYRDSIPWTDSTNGLGYTLEIKKYKGRTNDGKNYFAGCLGGSPGVAYTPNCKPFFPVAIQQVINEKTLLVLPSITQNEVSIQNYTMPFTYQIIDITGKKLNAGKSSIGSTLLDVGGFQNGAYYIIMHFENGQKISKKIIKL